MPTSFRANLSGCRILIVDDVQTNRELLSLILQDAGAEVEMAINGEQAIEAALRSPQLDLVLMDMQMPVLDGYSATQILRKHGFEQPIIALTAHSLEEERNRCLSVGMNGFLVKPLQPAAIAAVIAEFCGDAAHA